MEVAEIRRARGGKTGQAESQLRGPDVELSWEGLGSTQRLRAGIREPDGQMGLQVGSRG